MKKRNAILLLIVLILFINILPSQEAVAEKDPTSEIEEKLDSITDEEREILSFLFSQVQEIEGLERENKRLKIEINEMKIEIEELEKKIFYAEEGYAINLLALESLFKSYQRMGSASYLEIVLESESLRDLIRRINILRDLSRNSKELLNNIEREKSNLEEEKIKLNLKLEQVEEKQGSLEDAIEKKQILVREKEEYLESLSDNREIYEERLEYISLVMEELKDIIGEFTIEFTKVVQGGNFPRNAVKERITLKGIEGTIEEKTFNTIIKNQKNLPPMEFRFQKDYIEMNIPEKNLYLSGNFNIKDDRVLAFEPKEGRFLDMSLEKGTIEDLFQDGDFVFDLEPLIGKGIVKAIDIEEGYIKLLVGIKLF